MTLAASSLRNQVYDVTPRRPDKVVEPSERAAFVNYRRFDATGCPRFQSIKNEQRCQLISPRPTLWMLAACGRFRDKLGRVGLIGDRCSHRSASLCYGRVEERGKLRRGEALNDDASCAA